MTPAKTMDFCVTPMPVRNTRGSLTAAEDAAHYYDLIPTGFGYRLVITPKANPWARMFGWRYRDLPTVLAAVREWDPQTQNEPAAWIQRLTREIRWAPQADQDPYHNRLRCVHGRYLADGECIIDKRCSIHDYAPHAVGQIA